MLMIGKGSETMKTGTLMSVVGEQDKKNQVSFDAKKLMIGDLLNKSGERPYVIPSFQRPYCWSEDQVEQLVRDLLDFYDFQRENDKVSEYSLGTVVCEQTDSCFSILDGQQRLTTLELILNYLYKEFNKDKKEKVRLISCYQYLSGYEEKLQSPLPCHKIQERIIEEVIGKRFGGNKKGLEDKIPWKEIDDCVRKKIYITRVILPLVGKKRGEAERMFEIINVSGQKLSLLDQIKARLLSFIPEDRKEERTLVSNFWDALPEYLCQPKHAAEGFDFLRKAESSDVEFLKEEKLDEIIELSFREAVVQEMVDDEKKSYIKNKKEESNAKKEEKGTKESEDSQENLMLEPPIDVGNLLVVANELLRYSFGEKFSLDTKGSREDFFLKLSSKNFDWLTKETILGSLSISPTEKILRLIGTTNLLLQIVGCWGVYRQREKNGSEVFAVGEETPMHALQLSFMAENRFHYDAQYWFLMLAASALCGSSIEKQSLGERSTEVASFRENWTLSSEQLEKLQPLVFERLTGWAVHRACTSETGTEAALRWALLSNADFQRKFNEEIHLLSEVVKSWKYDDGLRHWQLYLLDWLLWNDSCNKKLQKTVDNFETFSKRVATGLKKFEWNDFSSLRKNFRIVRHGAIEHWFAQEMANEDRKVLDKLNGFGNLALIDTSLNSILRNLPVSGDNGKSKKVLGNNANHSLKLGWLAVFTKNCPNYDWDDVEALTNFWGAYMSNYPYEELVKNPKFRQHEQRSRSEPSLRPLR